LDCNCFDSVGLGDGYEIGFGLSGRRQSCSNSNRDFFGLTSIVPFLVLVFLLAGNRRGGC
jgi:hypothetical protein